MNENSNTQPKTDIASDWISKDAAQNRLRDELRPSNKSALFDRLAAAGITKVCVSFDGYGDSGQIESIVFKSGDETVAEPDGQIDIAEANWGQDEPERITASLSDAIERLAYDFLEQAHAGWEINDGAYGEFIFDVAARTITLDYNERFTDSEYSQHVF